MPAQRVHILGYIATGDPEGIHALRRLTEGEALAIFRSASEQGVAGFEARDIRYELRRNSDYTFSVQPADQTGLLT